MCNCDNKRHVLQTITVTSSNVVLNVTNATNVGSLEDFNLIIPCNKSIKDNVTGAPLPVQIVVNGTAVPLYNKYSIQITSNHVPRRSKGAYVVVNGAGYVILFTTPCCKANA